MVAQSLDWILNQDRAFLILEAHRRIAQQLSSVGLSIEVLAGDADFEPIDGHDRDQYMFYNSPDCFDRTPENFLTFKLRDEAGEIAAMQGARFESTGRLSLEEFQRIQLKRLHGGALSAGRASESQINPGAKLVSGNIVFHGDLMARRSPALPRGALECFCVMTQLVCLTKWDHDFSWCYLREKHTRSAISMRYSMFHQYPYAILWDDMPDPHFQSDWLAFNSRSDMEYLAQATLINDLSVRKQPSSNVYPLGSARARSSDNMSG